MPSRIVLSKVLAFPLTALAICSHHTHKEPSHVAGVMECVGFVLLVVAAMGRIWSFMFICGRKNSDVIMDGPYSIVRHPLYLFSFLGFVGAGLAFKSWTLAGGFGALFLITHWPALLREEARLTSIFGDAYREYARRVPRFFANPRLLTYTSSVAISPARFSITLLESVGVLMVFLLSIVVNRVHTAYPKSIILYLP